jgi:hypothetical protein
VLIATLAACTRPPAPEREPASATSGPRHSLSQDEAAVRMAELTDLKVRMQGDTAIVTGAYHEKANPMANPTNITTT